MHTHTAVIDVLTQTEVECTGSINPVYLQCTLHGTAGTLHSGLGIARIYFLEAFSWAA